MPYISVANEKSCAICTGASQICLISALLHKRSGMEFLWILEK